MIRHDCGHLKRVTSNDILERNKGTLRCDVHRAAPDGTTIAGMNCPSECMGYRPISNGKRGAAASPLTAIKEAFLSLMGKS